MKLSEEQCAELDVAFNEATLLGVEVHPERRIAALTLSVLTLPKSGPAPQDPRVQVLLSAVGRVAASLRNGAWNDPDAEVVPFSLDQLLEVVQSFNGQDIYGWEFFNVHEANLQKWGDRLSLDWKSGEDGRTNSLVVFQDPGNRILDLCLWFDRIQIRSPQGREIPIQEFMEGGQRWWEAMRAGDPRTRGSGIVPAG